MSENRTQREVMIDTLVDIARAGFNAMDDDELKATFLDATSKIAGALKDELF